MFRPDMFSRSLIIFDVVAREVAESRSFRDLVTAAAAQGTKAIGD